MKTKKRSAMIFALDIGNTNIVLGLMNSKTEEIVFTSRISSDHTKTVDEYAVLIQDVFTIRNIDLCCITGSIITSVVPNLSQTVMDAVTMLTGKKPIMVSNQLKTGLNITIDNPDQLGNDLIVNAVTALETYPTPIIIFDMGTATTVSVVDKQGNYAGGMIIPGVILALEALSNQASQLPHISLVAPPKIVGKNTTHCMQSGIVFGNAAMIDGIIDRITADLGETPTLLATGGLAGVIIKHCKHNIIYDDNLMLKGLLSLYRKNTCI